MASKKSQKKTRRQASAKQASSKKAPARAKKRTPKAPKGATRKAAARKAVAPDAPAPKAAVQDTPAPAAPAKPGRTGRIKGGPNKSAFIREQPETMSAKDVVKAAAAVGLVLAEGLVYNVRSYAKNKAAKTAPGPEAAPAVKRGPGRPSKASPAVAASASTEEVAFRRYVVTLGAARARALVAEVEAKLQAVIDGV